MSVRMIAEVILRKLKQCFPPDTRANATLAVEVGPNLTWLQGQLMAQKTSDMKFYPYNPAANDGTQVCVGPAVYSGATDALGQVFLGEGVQKDGLESTYDPTLEIHYGGWFNVADLIGLDAGAIAQMHARLFFGGTKILIPTNRHRWLSSILLPLQGD